MCDAWEFTQDDDIFAEQEPTFDPDGPLVVVVILSLLVGLGFFALPIINALIVSFLAVSQGGIILYLMLRLPR